MLKRRLAQIVLMAPLLFSCSAKQSSGETDGDALARMQDWGIEIPSDSSLIGRYYKKNDGWDHAPYPFIFYCISLPSEPEFLSKVDAIGYSEEYKAFLQSRIANLEDSSGRTASENELPKFDGEEAFFLVSGWRRHRVAIDDEGSRTPTYQYSFVFEKEYIPTDGLEQKDGFMNFARLHLVLQPKSMTLFALFQHWRS